MIKTVYVFFEEASIRLFFMKYLANGFSHCFTYEHQLLDKYDVFVKIESLFYCFDTDIFFDEVSPKDVDYILSFVHPYKGNNIILGYYTPPYSDRLLDRPEGTLLVGSKQIIIK